ncbi:MAG: hypothetical protein ACLRO1_03750 [Agathobaculum sp.]
MLLKSVKIPLKAHVSGIFCRHGRRAAFLAAPAVRNTPPHMAEAPLCARQELFPTVQEKSHDPKGSWPLGGGS